MSKYALKKNYKIYQICLLHKKQPNMEYNPLCLKTNLYRLQTILVIIKENTIATSSEF